MLGQRWPNALLEREWLALRWHIRSCWAKGVGSTANRMLAMSKMTSCQQHLSTLGQHYPQQNYKMTKNDRNGCHLNRTAEYSTLALINRKKVDCRYTSQNCSVNIHAPCMVWVDATITCANSNIYA